MRMTRDIMGMPMSVEVVDAWAAKESVEEIFVYFNAVDERFSTYKPESEIMRINRGELREEAWSEEMREIFALAKKTKKQTNGYFDIKKSDGTLDPSGVVK